MNIKSITDKYKSLKNPSPVTWDELASKIANDIAFKVVTEKVNELLPKVESAIKDEIRAMFEDSRESLKGDQGDKGDSYILTDEDIKEIASKIEPSRIETIVEKREVIVKEPVVTNQIVKETTEVAKYETAEQIAEKLNTLDEKIDISVIRGLRIRFDNIARAIKEKSGGKGDGKGGGMGNWVHQRWNVSSATTTLSLNSNIASDGEAHIFRYNGQVQDLDTDYTINGKVITLLFTPQDNTTASIAYVRK